MVAYDTTHTSNVLGMYRCVEPPARSLVTQQHESGALGARHEGIAPDYERAMGDGHEPAPFSSV